MIGTIKKEAAACRERFEGIEVGSWVRCCHHEELVEKLFESPKHRIKYILRQKHRSERARRLHEFWPIPKEMADEYFAKRKLISDEYLAKSKSIDDEFDAKLESINDEYDAELKPIYDEYRAKLKLINPEYRAKFKLIEDQIIALVPDTTWNGRSIFYIDGV